jgi:putative hydrolase of the HAD superfamily
MRGKSGDTGKEVEAVLFDLDDTLYDHRGSCRTGLASVRERYEELRRVSLDEIGAVYRVLLEELHKKVLVGELSIEDARKERFRRFFARFGEEVSEETAYEECLHYRREYLASRKPVDGAEDLLRALRGAVKIGVVTNNLVEEQREKLRVCGMEALVDELVVSEEVGVTKPDRGIFEEVLRRLGCRASESVMVGDSWDVDIVGARGAGIRAVWLNRDGISCPDASLAIEIRSLRPTSEVAEIIMQSNVPERH